jgi:hypothetical protein
LGKTENIVESGMVIKSRKLSKKKRYLILSDEPRLFYIDPKKMVCKVCASRHRLRRVSGLSECFSGFDADFGCREKSLGPMIKRN